MIRIQKMNASQEKAKSITISEISKDQNLIVQTKSGAIGKRKKGKSAQVRKILMECNEKGIPTPTVGI